MRARGRCSTRASGTSRRTASAAGSCSSSRSPRTSRCTTTATRPTRSGGGSTRGRLVERAKKLITEFDVRGGGPLTRASALSGGNQQKLVVAREVSRDPKVLIAAQPTRGLDVGAIEYLHRRLVDRARRGPGDPARLARARRGAVALGPRPRPLRGPDRRRARRRRRRGGDRARDAGRGQGETRRERACGDARGAQGELRGAPRDAAAPRRARAPDPDRAPRLPDGRPDRARDGPQSDHDLQGDLGRHRAQLALPHPVGLPRRVARRPQPAADADLDDDADPDRASRSRSPSAAACSTSAARASTSWA